MATKKKRAEKPNPESGESTWAELHRAYLSGGDLCSLARRFGVPFGEVDRRATLEHWELEREWRSAQVWHSGFGLGASTEEEFCERHAEKDYGHLVVQGDKGRALAFAIGRETWRRIMFPALQFEAVVEHDRAAEEFRRFEELRNRLFAGPRRKPADDSVR